jgi:dienelactone hydrolase
MQGRRIAAVMVAASLLTFGGAANAGAAPAIAPAKALAKHHLGPYAVGTRSYTFVDASRPTAPNGSYPGAPTRTLPTLLLYPAEGDPIGPAVENARPIRTRKNHRFPLIIFSHGVGASGPAYSFLLYQLVREGYVVAAPTFPLSNTKSPGGPTIADYPNQPADVSFVLTRVLRLARQHSGLRLTISRDHIGVLGHSLGAITTVGVATNSCCQDPRIDAAVAWSGIPLPFPGGSFFAKPTPPLLLVHGTADGTIPYGGSVGAYSLAPAPKAFVTLEGAPHVPFFGPWLEPTILSTTDFLDGYLKHDRKALRRLATDGNVAGVASLQEDLGGRHR